MEFLVELFQTSEFGLESSLRKDQSGDSEVVGARSLPESASRNQGNTSILEDFKAVHQVDCLILGSGSSNGLF